MTPAVLILHSSDTYSLIQFIQQWAARWLLAKPANCVARDCRASARPDCGEFNTLNQKHYVLGEQAGDWQMAKSIREISAKRQPTHPSCCACLCAQSRRALLVYV